jgi:hypothetical protein
VHWFVFWWQGLKAYVSGFDPENEAVRAKMGCFLM